jgi:hypothetical protein
LTGKKTWINSLKNLERASIFAVIAGSFGWNLDLTSVARSQVYRKSPFLKIKGFASIGKHRSGDDDLLLQKMSPHLRRRNFIFSPAAAVPSFDKESRAEMISLETRRASKWQYYPLHIKLLTLMIFIYYICLAAAFFTNISWIALSLMICLKISAEFVLLFVFLKRINRTGLLSLFPIAEILYIPYYIFFGIKGTFGKYKWKN